MSTNFTITGQVKPGQVIDLKNGQTVKVKSVQGEAVELEPAQDRLEVYAAYQAMQRAAGTGGSWAYLELIRAILLCESAAPDMSMSYFALLLRESAPAITGIVSARNNARLPFSGPLPFGIPSPGPVERTTVTRDENGLISSSEKVMVMP